MSSSRVAFSTVDGLTLRGDYFKADGEGRPIVVMTAGFTLPKEFVEPLAASFRRAGVSALAFDYRNYGSSDGEPRHETNLIQQGEDYRDALTAAASLDGVDPGKVVVWGIGHGGTGAAICAANDPRPAAVILQSPIVSGSVDARNFPEGSLDLALRDREERTRRGDTTRRYIKAWPESPEEAARPAEPILNPGEASYQLLIQSRPGWDAAGTPWENKVSSQSLLYAAGVEGKDYFPRITQPTLYIVAPADPFTGTAEYHREAFLSMGPNAEFHVYQPPQDVSFSEFLQTSIPPQVDFLKRVL